MNPLKVSLVLVWLATPTALTACWSSAARQAPRASVPTPSGATNLARECEQAASRAKFVIACPTSLPRGSDPFWGNGFGRGECDPGTCGPQRLPRWTWVGSYNRFRGAWAHVVVVSAPRPITAAAFIYLMGTVTPHPSDRVTVAAHTTVRGHSGEYVLPSLNPSLDPPPRTGGVIFLGHTVLIWVEHGHTYAIGVTGGQLNPRTAEATIARQLVFIGQAAHA